MRDESKGTGALVIGKLWWIRGGPSILFCTHAESGDCGLKCTLSVKLPRHRDAGKQRHCRFAGVCSNGVNGFSPLATIPARSRSTAS